jgi:hypothetical protein
MMKTGIICSFFLCFICYGFPGFSLHPAAISDNIRGSLQLALDPPKVRVKGGTIKTVDRVGKKADNKKTFNLSFYPNPASSIVHLKSEAEIEQVAIFAMNGKKVLEKAQNHVGIAVIRLDGLNKGVYLLRARTTDGLLLTKRLVVE